MEFANKREAKKFVVPEWFGEELTIMREATNAYMEGLKIQYSFTKDASILKCSFE